MQHTLLSLLILLAGYLSYRYLSLPSFFSRSEDSDPSDNSPEIYWRRYSTAFFYGGLTLTAIYLTGKDFTALGVGTDRFPAALLPGVMIGIILAGINLLNYRNADNLAAFPEIRKTRWSISTLIMSSLAWIVYLFAYEILFRGYLLFSMHEYIGKWPAITVNIILYSLVHFHKGWKETIGAVPLGFVLCLVCLSAGSFWPAFIAHLFLALSSEWLSLHAHPGLTLIRK